jgi:hypothetical protein
VAPLATATNHYRNHTLEALLSAPIVEFSALWRETAQAGEGRHLTIDFVRLGGRLIPDLQTTTGITQNLEDRIS